MATAAPPAPATPPVAYGDVTKAGVGSGVLVPPEVLSPQSHEAIQPKLVPITVTIGHGPAPSARQKSVLFGALADPGLRLRKPIPLEASMEETDVVLTWLEIDEFGCGDSTSAALEDFGQSIRELYHYLHAPDVQLGADLQRIRQILDQYIEPRK